MAVERNAVGFIGLGVMGEPMCRNLALKSGQTVYGYDRVAAPLERLAEHGVITATGLDQLAERCHTILLSLPSGDHVSAVCNGPEGLLALMEPGQYQHLACRPDPAARSRFCRTRHSLCRCSYRPHSAGG